MGSFARLLRSELRLAISRRRNQAGLLVLAAVPVLMAIAIRINGVRHREGRADGAGFVDQITANGLFVPFATLTLELTLFLPLALAMVSGDAIAGEAHQGTLRYLLTVPVARTRLLAVKYLALVVGAFVAVGVVLLAGLGIGVALFGAHPMLTLSGTEISVGQGLWRLVLSGLYVVAGLCAFAAIGLFLSTLTEQPIAATISITLLVTLAWILDGIPQLDWLHPYLLVDRWTAFGDVMRQPILTDTMATGALVALAYIAVFLAAAWARFGGKDITT